MNDTSRTAYARRLLRLQTKRWKRYLGVQLPYRWNLRRLEPGFTLELGCGIGRNLSHLDGHAVGIDHNAECVHVCRQRGFRAFTPQEFLQSEYSLKRHFDTLLTSHVLEHMTPDHALALLTEYVCFIKPGGMVIVITPQEAGYASDTTHVTFVDFGLSCSLLQSIGCRLQRQYSFPFPRPIGRIFLYNEFVTVGRLLDRKATCDALA